MLSNNRVQIDVRSMVAARRRSLSSWWLNMPKDGSSGKACTGFATHTLRNHGTPRARIDRERGLGDRVRHADTAPVTAHARHRVRQYTV